MADKILLSGSKVGRAFMNAAFNLGYIDEIPTYILFMAFDEE